MIRTLLVAFTLLVSLPLMAQEVEQKDTIYMAWSEKYTPKIEVKNASGEVSQLRPRRMRSSEMNYGGVHFVRLPKLDLFLCIGQSNMAGRGWLDEEHLQPMEDAYLFNAEERFEVAHDPMNRYSTIRKEMPMQRVGPVRGFMEEYTQKTGRKVGVVVNARGNTSINQWLPEAEDAYFEEALKRLEPALRWGELKGILWHQGEADCSHPEWYEAKLRKLITALRERVGKDNLPVVFGEISHWNWTKRKAGTKPFNQMLQSLEIPHTRCASAEGLQPMKDETDPHFSAQSQDVLGERMATLMLDLLK